MRYYGRWDNMVDETNSRNVAPKSLIDAFFQFLEYNIIGFTDNLDSTKSIKFVQYYSL